MNSADKRLIIRGLSVPDLENAAAVREVLAGALARAHIACLQGPQFSDVAFQRWQAIVPLIGKPQREGENGATGEKDGSMWLDVRYDEARSHTFRHSSTPQPLHTDSAYNAEPVDKVFFLSQQPASGGGETIFVSADTVEQIARDYDSALHRQMWELPLPYGKGSHRGRQVPVLRRDEAGLLINWNYYRVLEESPAIAEFRQHFFTFLQEEIVAKGRVEPVQLRSGEVALFEDQRVLHGRFAFEPSPRCIWKCGLERLA